MYKCTRCEREFEKLISISIHFRSAHKSTSKQLYIELFCNNTQPTCACGCNENTKFHSIETGFSKYRWGHASNVNNNWGHNAEALRKSKKSRRENLASGKTVMWNKGLDKSDSRIMKQINNMISKRNAHHKEWRDKISETHAQNHINGKSNSHTHGNASHFTCTKNLKANEIYCRSSYERNFYTWLEQNENVKYYINEPYKVKYIFENVNHFYVVDALVRFKDRGKDTLVEIKAAWLLNDEINQAKFTAAKEFALANDFDFEIWTEETHDFLNNQ